MARGAAQTSQEVRRAGGGVGASARTGPVGEGAWGSIEEQPGDRVGEPFLVVGGAPAAVAGQAVVDGRVDEQPYLIDRVAPGYSLA